MRRVLNFWGKTIKPNIQNCARQRTPITPTSYFLTPTSYLLTLSQLLFLLQLKYYFTTLPTPVQFVIYYFYYCDRCVSFFRRFLYETAGFGWQQSGEPGLLRYQAADNQGWALHQRHFRLPEYPAQPAFRPPPGRCGHCLGRKSPHLPPYRL